MNLFFDKETLINLENIAHKVLSEYDDYFDWRRDKDNITQDTEYFILMRRALHKAYRMMDRFYFIVDIDRKSVIEEVKEECMDLTDKIAIHYFIIDILESDIFRLIRPFQTKVANLVNLIPPNEGPYTKEAWDFLKNKHEEDMNLLRLELAKYKENPQQTFGVNKK